MFDALEKKWKNTDQANLINQLYQGHMKDYVKCLECGYESARNDAFLDIPLVIRPFGETQAYGSVVSLTSLDRMFIFIKETYIRDLFSQVIMKY